MSQSNCSSHHLCFDLLSAFNAISINIYRCVEVFSSVLSYRVLTGIEGKINLRHTRYSYSGPVTKNSIIVGGAGSVSSGCTSRGIILPFSEGLMVQ